MSKTKEVELVGGPACGRLVTVLRAVTTIQVPVPPPLLVVDCRNDRDPIDGNRRPEIHLYRESDPGLVFTYAGLSDDTAREGQS